MDPITSSRPKISAYFDQGLASKIGNYSRAYFSLGITLIQILADLLTVVLSFVGSYAFYVSALNGQSPQTLSQFLLFSLTSGGLYLLILDRMGLYRREISLLNIKEMRGIARTGIYSGAVILSASFYLRSLDFSRITITTALLVTPVALYLQRQIFYQIHLIFHLRGWSQTRVWIYGAGSIGTHIAKKILQSPSLGMLPVAFLDDTETKHGQHVRWAGMRAKDAGIPVLGGESWLPRAKEFGVDLVLIALPSAKFERNRDLVEKCADQQIEYAVVPNSYEKFVQDVELFELAGIPIFRKRVHRTAWSFLISKRVFDFVMATLMILILSPLYLLFAVLIKLETRGPIIFKQKRVGLNGRQFSIYKFRSMSLDAPKYAVTPSNPHDPRITRVGRWLRRTSLDELPQLFNVWRGDMSLVGPRPEMPFIVERYTPLERQRLLAKPGITGVWQISAARSEPIHRNIEYDLFYLENRSLLLDFAILVKTFLSVIRGIGAF